jgi:tetratricopeptide (TPR) repeat protein
MSRPDIIATRILTPVTVLTFLLFTPLDYAPLRASVGELPRNVLQAGVRSNPSDGGEKSPKKQLEVELQQYQRALAAARQRKDRGEEINALVYLGLTYEKLDKHREALTTFKEVLGLTANQCKQR